jgi:hypothetical protein
MKSIQSKLGKKGKVNARSQNYGLKSNGFKSSKYGQNLTHTQNLANSNIYASGKFRGSNRSNSPRLNLSQKKPIKIKINKHSRSKLNRSKRVSREEEDLMNEECDSQGVSSIGKNNS